MSLRIPAPALHTAAAIALLGCAGDGAIVHVASLELDVNGLVLGDDGVEVRAGAAGGAYVFDVQTGAIGADWSPSSGELRVEDVKEGGLDDTLLLLDDESAWLVRGGAPSEPWRFHAVHGGRLIDGGAALITSDEVGGCSLQWVGDWGRVPGPDLPPGACALGEIAGDSAGLFVAAGDSLIRSDRSGSELLDVPATRLASDGERLYVVADGELQALDLDGERLWAITPEAEIVDLDIAEGIRWVVVHTRLPGGGGLVAYETRTGVQAAELELPSVGSEISAGDEDVALALPGELHVFSLTP